MDQETPNHEQPAPGELPPQPEGPFDGMSMRAIAIGVVVDHLATITFVIFLVAILLPSDISPDDQEAVQAAMESVASSSQYLISALIGGLLCTVLAAFVGARRATCKFAQHGLWIAGLSAALVLLLAPAESDSPAWFEVAGWVLQLPAGMLGGVLAQWAIAYDMEPDEP